MGLSWPLYRVVDGLLQVMWTSADGAGWYPVLADADGWFSPHLLVEWPTGQYANGLYSLEVDLGNVAKAVISISAAVRFRIDKASATHLRSVTLSGGGCGGGAPVLVSALSTVQHWHTGPADNSVGNTAVFALSGGAPQGVHLLASGRAFNPSGGDGGHLADWNYDPVYAYVVPMLPVAVVNA
ncbi:MAG: hypothetical protein QN168_02400 [Armatimonadota bacterium]|nr:hypothetical protein [Armatimonadota bacterium]